MSVPEHISGKFEALDPNRVARRNPKMALKLMQSALDTYYGEFGNTDVPEDWIVPSGPPWAPEIWGLQLGKMVWALGLSLSTPKEALMSSSRNGAVKERDGGTETSSSMRAPSPVPSYGSSTIQHSENNEPHHRSETWYELFYDLVFVASSLQLGLIIKYDHRPLGLIKAAILFYMLRSTWDHLTTYQNRFHYSDVTHMSFYILQAMGAFVISLHLRIEESVHFENEFSWDRSTHQRPIALTAGVLRMLTAVMYLREAYNTPKNRPYIFRVVIHTTLSTCVYFSSLYCSVTDSQRTYLW
eukprot:CAMPEP_0182438084 /NCGR_PEP_ID=MMETSP1167-20130531/85489_1 /TAXON_ID=2988 /ORGANISM="Mallomonas Sp, Strain CCMP3275" /LENGTH=298 /DNA_ID=CAMNT_0024631259 /DNA_START=244 /DNA_END=1137 /DNA_ORIENTATION=-